MTSEWRSCALGDALTLQRGFDLPVTQRIAGRVPVIASTGQVGWHNTSPLVGPGVVIGRSGSIGGGQYIEGVYWPLNTTLWIKDFKGNDPRYCYYLLKSMDFQQFNVGSGVPTLNRNHIHPLPIFLPPIDAQRHISTLLGSLDDRIDNLRQTTATLEAIAQALFKSWFVDFDPVRAKAEGREPEGMDAATAALFPSEFEDSEVGPIPRSWSCSRFGELLVERSERVRNQKAIVMSAVQSGKLVRSDEHFNKRVHSADISKYKLVQPLAFAYNPSRINIGSIGLNEGGAVGAVSPIYVVAEASGAEVAYFVWHHLRTEAVKRRIVGLCSGSVRQSLSAADFFSLPVVIPDARILSAFHSVRQSLHDKVHSNESQASLLADMRDTLLPQLISGKLRLPEAEAAVEKALV